MKGNITESASKIRKIFFDLVSCGFSDMKLHPLTLKRIYESMVLPRALYGCERWSNLSQTYILLLERSHRLCIKTMQNMDRNTRTCAALSLFGTSNLNYVIHKRKLTLFGQPCRRDTFYAAKRLFLYRITSQYLYEDIECGFISDIFQMLKDYDLEHMLADFMNSGNFLSKYSWKRLIHMKMKSCASTSEGLELFLVIQPESSLDTHTLCWFCHVAAHIICTFCLACLLSFYYRNSLSCVVQLFHNERKHYQFITI